MVTITWTSPDSGQLTSLIEYEEGSPVYEATLQANDSELTEGSIPIYYTLLEGEIPLYYEIIQTSGNTGYLRIEPIVEELDKYVENYEKPDEFTYDTDNTAGANYASFGSALSGGYTFNFTLRAYDATGLSTYTDSNGNLQYDVDSNFTAAFSDRNFSIFVFNNWSSDGRSFLSEYFQGQTVIDGNGNSGSVNDYLNYLTSIGNLII